MNRSFDGYFHPDFEIIHDFKHRKTHVERNENFFGSFKMKPKSDNVEKISWSYNLTNSHLNEILTTSVETAQNSMFNVFRVRYRNAIHWKKKGF